MARGKVKSALALNDPVAMVDMPLLVRLLWKGKNVFSRSWLRDWFVVFKNRHAFFSVFLCHPQHPFTWKERFFLIVCVLMMGWALATAAEVALTRRGRRSRYRSACTTQLILTLTLTLTLTP